MERVNVYITGYKFYPDKLVLYEGVDNGMGGYFPGPDITINPDDTGLIRFIEENGYYYIEFRPYPVIEIFFEPDNETFIVDVIRINMKNFKEVINFVKGMINTGLCKDSFGDGSWKCKSFSEKFKQEFEKYNIDLY